MAGVKEYKFEVPSKKVKCPEMVRVWEESESYQEYLGESLYSPVPPLPRKYIGWNRGGGMKKLKKGNREGILKTEET